MSRMVKEMYPARSTYGAFAAVSNMPALREKGNSRKAALALGYDTATDSKMTRVALVAALKHAVLRALLRKLCDPIEPRGRFHGGQDPCANSGKRERFLLTVRSKAICGLATLFQLCEVRESTSAMAYHRERA
jgi:hypothetical protein